MMDAKTPDINIYAGRPGAGKTAWIRKETQDLLKDSNNAVVYIGHRSDGQDIMALADGCPGKLIVAQEGQTAMAIGRAVDAAVREGLAAELDPSEEGDAVALRKVFIMYEQCRYTMHPAHRDLLTAAAKAGVQVNVICQKTSQVDGGDVEWLHKNCSCYIISKGRDPRMAKDEEITGAYR